MWLLKTALNKGLNMTFNNGPTENVGYHSNISLQTTKKMCNALFVVLS